MNLFAELWRDGHRRAAILSLMPRRILCAWACLRGQGVAYRIVVRNGGIESKTDCIYVMECDVIGDRQ